MPYAMIDDKNKRKQFDALASKTFMQKPLGCSLILNDSQYFLIVVTVRIRTRSLGVMGMQANLEQ